MNTKVTFSAEDDGSVQSTVDRLRGSASALARDMAKEAQEQAGSAREAVTLIEDQIRAIQRRNQLDQQSEKVNLREQLQSGEITQAQFKTKSGALSLGGQQDDLQIRLTRDLIQTILDTSREQIDANKDNLEDAVSAEDRASLDPLTQLKNSLVDEYDDSDIRDTGGNGLRQAGAFGVQEASRAAVSKNEIYALAGLTAAIPIVGQAISGVLGKAFSQAEALQTAKAGVNALTNDQIGNLGGGAAKYGMGMSEFMQLSRQSAVARGGLGDNLEGDTYDLISLSKGMGLSNDGLLQSLKGSRSEGNGVMNNVGALFSQLSRTGQIDGDFSKMEEYLQIANQLAASQNLRLDTIDSNLNANVIANLSEAGGSFRDPQVLQGIISSLDSSLQNPQSKYAQALQFSVLSKQNPNSSRIDLMKMQEKGIAQPGLLGGMMEMFSGMAGGNEDFMTEQVKAAFPQLSFAQAQRLSKSYQSGNLDLSFDDKGLGTNEDELRTQLGNRSAKTTGFMQRQTAEVDNVLAQKGDELSMKIGNLTNAAGGISGALGSMMDVGIGLTDALNSAISLFSDSRVTTVLKATNKISSFE